MAGFNLFGFGNPFERMRRSGSPFKTEGVSGTTQIGGFIAPKDIEPTGEARLRDFSETLKNISIVAAGVRYFLNITSRAAWKFESADDSPQAKEYAEKMDEAIHSMVTPWFRVVRRMAMFKFYGFSVQEWTAKKGKDGFNGLSDIEARPQRTITRWDFDDTGTVYGVVQRNPHMGGGDRSEIYLPRNKLVYAVDDSLDDSPEGLGLFSHLAEPVERLKEYRDIERAAFRTDLRGIPIVRAPFAEMNAKVKAGALTETERTANVNAVMTFLQNHFRNVRTGYRLDSEVYKTTNEAQQPSNVPKWALELLQGEGGPYTEIGAAIARVTAEIARILNVEHLLLGADNRGAFNLSEDKSLSFGLIVAGTLDECRATVDQDVVAPVATMNGWPEELWPKSKTDGVEFRDITTLTTAVQQLEAAGLQPDDEAHDVIRDRLGLPHRPEMMEALPGELDPFGQETPDAPRPGGNSRAEGAEEDGTVEPGARGEGNAT